MVRTVLSLVTWYDRVRGPEMAAEEGKRLTCLGAEMGGPISLNLVQCHTHAEFAAGSSRIQNFCTHILPPPSDVRDWRGKHVKSIFKPI